MLKCSYVNINTQYEHTYLKTRLNEVTPWELVQAGNREQGFNTPFTLLHALLQLFHLLYRL